LLCSGPARDEGRSIGGAALRVTSWRLKVKSAVGLSLECGGPAPLWSAAAWRCLRCKHSTVKVRAAEGWTKAAPGRRTPRRRPIVLSCTVARR
jgi:hypothetical protein